MPFIIAALILLIGGIVLIAAKSGLFRIEKIEIEQSADIEFPDLEGSDEDDSSDEEDDRTLKEKMNIGGYFEEEEEAKSPEPKNSSEEKGKQTYDRISEFKTGRGFLIDCQKLLNEAKSGGDMYAALYFDFDRFRFINSLKGQSIGDYVLTKMSHELKEAFPNDQMKTRLSADHFVMILPAMDGEYYEMISDRIALICEKIRNDVGLKGALRIHAGIAVAQSEHDYDISIMIHKANVARHCIKTSRSESYKLFDESMLTTNLFGESALDDYVENQYDDDFVVYYTPQEDIILRQITGSEALVRWACEDGLDRGAYVDPYKGKIPTNGSKIIYHVCKSMSRWRKSGKKVLPVSVHMPVTELMKTELDDFIAKVLSEFQLEPSLLNIVVEASIIRMDWSAVQRQLERVRHIGVGIGVDEIDTGYATLDFLRGLPINFIKLHRSYLADIENNEERQGKIKHFLAVSKDQKFQIIFEGVDSQRHYDTLQSLGANMIQGSCCGKPRLADDFASGLNVHVEKKKTSSGTVILDDITASQGDYKLF